MNELYLSTGILVLSVAVASVSQILLKLSADKSHDGRLKEYLNPYVITAYGMLFLSTILTMIALKRVPLSMSPVIESLGYIFVSVLGYCFLKERFSRRKILGLILILTGVAVFHIPV